MQIRVTADSNPEDIFNNILKLPPLRASGWQAVDPKETVLCLQREIAIVQTNPDLISEELNSPIPGEVKKPAESTSPVHLPIKYVGTKGILCCLFVYIYSPTDHFIIHCDHLHTFQFLEAINEFKTKDSLKVVIIGGSASYLDITRPTLRYIILQLKAVAKALSIPVDIVGQKVLHHNKLTPEESRIAIFEVIMDRANLLYRRLFKKIPDFSRLKLTPDLLERPGSINTAFNTMIDEVSAYTVLDSRIYDIKLTPSEFEKTLCDFLNQKIKNRMDTAMKGNDTYRPISLSDFVVDIKSKNIFHIPSYTATYQHQIRAVRSIDNSCRDYHVCFINGGYLAPQLKQRLLKLCQEVTEKKTDHSYLVKDDVLRLCFGYKALAQDTGVAILFLQLFQAAYPLLKTKPTYYPDKICFFVSPEKQSRAREFSTKISDAQFTLEDKGGEVKAHCSLNWLRSLSRRALNELTFGADDELGERDGIGFPLLSSEKTSELGLDTLCTNRAKP